MTRLISLTLFLLFLFNPAFAGGDPQLQLGQFQLRAHPDLEGRAQTEEFKERLQQELATFFASQQGPFEEIGRGATARILSFEQPLALQSLFDEDEEDAGEELSERPDIAIKVILKNTADARTERDFLSEYHHTNIIQTYFDLTLSNQIILVMPLYPMSLLNWAQNTDVKERSQMLLRLFEQIFQAVRYLHQNGKVHNDLKSANIMLTNTFQIRLIDFGLLTNEGYLGHAMRGTPIYMTPTTLSCRARHTAEKDRWSLGIVALEVASGKEFVTWLKQLVSRIYVKLEQRQAEAILLYGLDLSKRPEFLEVFRRSFSGNQKIKDLICENSFKGEFHQSSIYALLLPNLIRLSLGEEWGIDGAFKSFHPLILGLTLEKWDQAAVLRWIKKQKREPEGFIDEF